MTAKRPQYRRKTLRYPWQPVEDYVRSRWPQAYEFHHGGAVGPVKNAYMVSVNHDPMPKPTVTGLVGISPMQLCLYRRKGTISEWRADEIATGLGLHPSVLWDSWFSDVELTEAS